MINEDASAQNLVIMSKFVFKNAHYLKITDRKYCLCAEIELYPKLTVSIVNVHLPADPRHNDETNNDVLRQVIVTDLDRWLKNKFDQTNYLIIGDFNDKSEDIKLTDYICHKDEKIST